MNLARQHFLQSVEAIKIGKNLKLPEQKVINLNKKNPKFKTIFLDLDETLIHTTFTKPAVYDYESEVIFNGRNTKIYTAKRFGLESFLF